MLSQGLFLKRNFYEKDGKRLTWKDFKVGYNFEL